MKRETTPKTGIRLWAAVLWLAVWWLASAAVGWEVLLPSPAAALARLGAMAATGGFWRTVGTSVSRILGGFFLACGAAVCCAALAGRWRRAAEVLAVPVAVVKAVPVASFIILALLWADSEHLALLISGLMVFPPVYLNVLEGVRRTDPQLLEMARVFQVPPVRRLRGIYLPQTLPYFRTACSLALGLCWKAGVAAEVIGVLSGSIGGQLYNAKVYFETAELFAWTVTIVAVSAAFERLFLRLIDALAGKAGA